MKLWDPGIQDGAPLGSITLQIGPDVRDCEGRGSTRDRMLIPLSPNLTGLPTDGVRLSRAPQFQSPDLTLPAPAVGEILSVGGP